MKQSIKKSSQRHFYKISERQHRAAGYLHLLHAADWKSDDAKHNTKSFFLIQSLPFLGTLSHLLVRGIKDLIIKKSYTVGALLSYVVQEEGAALGYNQCSDTCAVMAIIEEVVLPELISCGFVSLKNFLRYKSKRLKEDFSTLDQQLKALISILKNIAFDRVNNQQKYFFYHVEDYKRFCRIYKDRMPTLDIELIVELPKNAVYKPFVFDTKHLPYCEQNDQIVFINNIDLYAPFAHLDDTAWEYTTKKERETKMTPIQDLFGRVAVRLSNMRENREDGGCTTNKVHINLEYRNEGAEFQGITKNHFSFINVYLSEELYFLMSPDEPPYNPAANELKTHSLFDKIRSVFDVKIHNQTSIPEDKNSHGYLKVDFEIKYFLEESRKQAVDEKYTGVRQPYNKLWISSLPSKRLDVNNYASFIWVESTDENDYKRENLESVQPACLLTFGDKALEDIANLEWLILSLSANVFLNSNKLDVARLWLTIVETQYTADLERDAVFNCTFYQLIKAAKTIASEPVQLFSSKSANPKYFFSYTSSGLGHSSLYLGGNRDHQAYKVCAKGAEVRLLEPRFKDPIISDSNFKSRFNKYRYIFSLASPNENFSDEDINGIISSQLINKNKLGIIW